MQVVRCNNCGWIGKEEELLIDLDIEHCPRCGDTDMLMDIDKSFGLDSQEVEKLWELFGDVPVNEDDITGEEFIGFPEGTNRIEIWHWFDAVYQSGVAELMNGRNEEG